MNTSNIIKKIFKTIALIFLILVCFVIIEIVYSGTHTYLGYCWEEGKEDVRYTIEEKRNFAVEHYLEGQSYYDLRQISENKGEQYKVIKYKDINDFYEINPNCCELKASGHEGMPFGFWERVDGVHGIYDIKNTVRYYDDQGVYKEVTSKDNFFVVNNCGEVGYGFF